jgi:hypothetical protein
VGSNRPHSPASTHPAAAAAASVAAAPFHSPVSEREREGEREGERGKGTCIYTRTHTDRHTSLERPCGRGHAKGGPRQPVARNVHAHLAHARVRGAPLCLRTREDRVQVHVRVQGAGPYLRTECVGEVIDGEASVHGANRRLEPRCLLCADGHSRRPASRQVLKGMPWGPRSPPPPARARVIARADVDRTPSKADGP